MTSGNDLFATPFFDHETFKAFLAWVRFQFGYDFRDYEESSLARQLGRYMENERVSDIGILRNQLTQNPSLLFPLINQLTVSTTELFRDPDVFFFMRKHVLPLLKRYDVIKIWHAGCSTGQEVISMAILLAEEELLERTILYATDVDRVSISTAKRGIIPTSSLKRATMNYHRAGGTSSLLKYWTIENDLALLHAPILNRIVFSEHNLATDSKFATMQLVLCRNVLIYFNKELQERALSLLSDSLDDHGLLCLGTRESLKFSGIMTLYRVVSPSLKIYQKIESKIRWTHQL